VVTTVGAEHDVSAKTNRTKARNFKERIENPDAEFIK